jgi:hypothetical protein
MAWLFRDPAFQHILDKMADNMYEPLWRYDPVMDKPISAVITVCSKCGTVYTSNSKPATNPCKCDWKADIPDRPTPLESHEMIWAADD